MGTGQGKSHWNICGLVVENLRRDSKATQTHITYISWSMQMVLTLADLGTGSMMRLLTSTTTFTGATRRKTGQRHCSLTSSPGMSGSALGMIQLPYGQTLSSLTPPLGSIYSVRPPLHGDLASSRSDLTTLVDRETSSIILAKLT